MRRSLAALAIAAGALMALVPAAHAGKTVEATWGGGGATGGLFDNIGDVAVRNSTGQVYVSDPGSDRIQRFDAAGNFELAWGAGVTAPGGTGDAGGPDEQQTISVNNLGGTFSLSFRPDEFGEAQKTAFLETQVPAATIEAALEGLSNIEPADVTVAGSTGGPWTVTFAGAFAGTGVENMGVVTTGTAQVSVTETQRAGSFEICSVAPECRVGVPGDPGGFLTTPDELAIDQTTGHVYVVEGDRISQFTADGEFVRAFGWDVIAPGKAGNVAGNEVQTFTLSSNATGGTFKLHFQGEETPIPYDATAAQVQEGLESMANVAPGDVAVAGPAKGPWTVTFQGNYADEDVLALSVEDRNGPEIIGILPDDIPFPFMEFNTLTDGGRYEVCNVAADCKVGVGGALKAPRTVNLSSQTGNSSSGGSGAGQIVPGDLGFAVSPPTGNVVLGSGRRISEYLPDGSFVRAYGWGVDTGGDQFEICTLASECQHATLPAGHTVSGWPFTENGQITHGPTALAVDSAGVVHAAHLFTVEGSGGFNDTPERGKPFVTHYDSTKTAPGELLLPTPVTSGEESPRCEYCIPGPLPFDPATQQSTGHGSNGIAFDLGLTPGSENLLYQASEGIFEIGLGTTPATLLDTHIPGGRTRGLGVNATGDLFYVSRGRQVIIVGDNAGPPATVSLDPVSDITLESATLSGEVTPNGPAGIQTSYRFEFSTDGTTWTKIPSKDVVIGDGNEPVEVTQPLTDLEPNTEYRVRLIATKELGLGSVSSPIVTFSTDTAPVEVQTRLPQRITPTTATLVGTVDANNSPATYYFEYGETAAYGNRVPIPDGTVTGNGPKTVKEKLTGLEPGTAYHYRVVATNGVDETPGDAIVEGADAEFETRLPVGSLDGRAYEMVTPPFKVVRSAGGWSKATRNNPNLGTPSLSGETIGWQVPFFPLTDDVGWPANNDRRIIRRTVFGWVNETLNTKEINAGTLPVFLRQMPVGTSGDLEASAIATTYGTTLDETGGLLPVEGDYASRHYTFRKGTGDEGFSSFLHNPERQVLLLGRDNPLDLTRSQDTAYFNDDGSAMARSGWFGGVEEDYSTPVDEDPSDNGPLQGTMVYLQRASDPLEMPTAPKDLVNECTGSGTSATRILERTAGGHIRGRTCTPGTLTSKRGAVIGGGWNGDNNPEMDGTGHTALSNDGQRLFFQSPSPHLSPNTCTSDAGAGTNCPPQLFVRQYSLSGTPTVRWVSHSRSVPGPGNSFTGTVAGDEMIANQTISQVGAGVSFQAASRDGRYVFFQTNAPLVPSDPNGGKPVVSGGVSNLSWDLYRYELPAGLDADPDAGTLLRVTGGPTGTADPNANAAGDAASLRFHSEDGSRAYLVTRSPIAGTDETPPRGGGTVPGGTPDGAIRNLYVWDADPSGGGGTYRFIARFPTSLLSACAESGKIGLGSHLRSSDINIFAGESNCFRGTKDGSHVVFASDGQLTADDSDDAGDVYLYDHEEDELVRISAPPPGAEPYTCNGLAGTVPSPGTGCNGDLGMTPGPGLGGDTAGLPGKLGWGGPRHFNVAKNPDGTASVFFESRSELIPEDTNGDYWDTYEWRNGELFLISPGNSEDDSWFSGNDVSGEDVFIWTSARIDPRELDDKDFDLYDARRGSAGFPYTPPPTPCDVLAHQCRSTALPSPTPRGSSSVSNTSPGNVKEKKRFNKKKRCRKGKVRRKGRCIKRKANKRQSGKRGKRANSNKRGGRR